MMKINVSILLVISALAISGRGQDLHIHFKGDSVRTYPVSQVDSITFSPCLPESLTIIALEPSTECVTLTGYPAFSWETLVPIGPPIAVTYTIKIVEGRVGESPEEAMASDTAVFTQADIRNMVFQYPQTAPKLKDATPYYWQVRAWSNGIAVAASAINPFHILSTPFPYDLSEVYCCKNSLVENGSLQLGLQAGPMNSTGAAAAWFAAYGAPRVAVDSGCEDTGYISLAGTQIGGQCIAQTFAPTHKIIQGKHYRVSFCLRFTGTGVRGDAGYVKIQAIAFNGTLPTFGSHPQASSTVAHVGQSGMMSTHEWMTTALPVWTANKTFDAIAFYALSNSADSTARCDIDNLCIVETNDSVPCDDYAYTNDGQPVVPTYLSPFIDTTLLQPAEYREDATGSVSDLYGYLGNTALATWYPNNDPCASIGGTIPPDVQNYNADDSLAGMGFDGGAATLDSILSTVPVDSSRPDVLTPIATDSTICDKPFVADNSQPFGGRDIIFVHGLQLNHFCDFKHGTSGAGKNWPQDKNEFYDNGYFKQVAENNWSTHIARYVAGHSNRYLVVSYNCRQRLRTAVHAVLTQIRDAMATGRGVKCPFGPKYADTTCFGRNCVIISHSTGGPVTDVAMAIANMSKTDPNIRAEFGDIGFISDRVRAHISLNGAQSGSRLASLALNLASNPTLMNIASAEFADHGCTDIADPPFASIFQNSVLYDLEPGNMKTLWGGYINATPVPVLTVSGGHPSGVTGPVKYFLHPGLDDGVVTMSSASSNPNAETAKFPSGYYRNGNSFKVMDMGIPLARRVGYYLDQTLMTAGTYIGGASVTHLSATGMVQPVSYTDPMHDPENRYANHYSFIQCATDHPTGAHGPFTNADESYKLTGGDENIEESLALTDMFPYNSGLVSPAMMTMQVEHVRGLYFWIPISYPTVTFSRHWPFVHFGTALYLLGPITVWERKYHNLAGYEQKNMLDYIYTYVLRP